MGGGGGLKNLPCTKEDLSKLTDVAQKGVIGGGYLLITFSLSCQHDQLMGVCSDRIQKMGLRHGSD